jgi:hypothetical protein
MSHASPRQHNKQSRHCETPATVGDVYSLLLSNRQHNSNWFSVNRREGYISPVTKITVSQSSKVSSASEVSIGDRHGECEDVESAIICESNR